MSASYSIRVNEKATFKYTASLVDETGTPLGPTDLASLTATLYDQLTGAAINGRTNQNVLNANNFTLTTGPNNLNWDSPSADNPIINVTLETEVHILLLQWTYGAGAAFHGNKEIAIRVVNINKVS